MDEHRTDTPAMLFPPPTTGGRAYPHAPAPRAQQGGGEAGAAASGAPLPAGAAAPDFALPPGPHRMLRPADFRGAPLVLAFYVADWHPVCTEQLARYQELLPEFGALGAALVAVSTDSPWSHSVFARERRLGFPLLADYAPRGAVARLYRVYSRATGSARRSLFVIDAAGIIRWSAAFPTAVDPGVDGIFTALEALAGVAPSDAAGPLAQDA